MRKFADYTHACVVGDQSKEDRRVVCSGCIAERSPKVQGACTGEGENSNARGATKWTESASYATPLT